MERDTDEGTLIHPQLMSHILRFVLREEIDGWMDAEVNTSAGKGTEKLH